MKTTINYGLKKPEGTDVVNIEDLNYNADVIDKKIKEVDTKASNIKVPVTSVNGKTGAVTLAVSDLGAVPTSRKVNNKPLSADIALSANDIKTSSGSTVESQLAQIKTDIGSETLQTTKKNLKGAINEVFQFANEGKKSIANAVTNKGVPASPSDTFPTLANKIGQIETGYGVGSKINPSDLIYNFNLRWDKEFQTDQLNGITIDNNGYIYVCSDDGYVRKISHTGAEIWGVKIDGTRYFCIKSDKRNHIYVGGNAGKLIKMDTDGNIIWSKAVHTDLIFDIVCKDNYIYTSSWDKKLLKLDENCNVVWEYIDRQRILRFAIDSEDNIIYTSYYHELIKIDKNGNEIFKKTETSSTSHVVIDEYNNIYYDRGESNGAMEYIRKLKPNGSIINEVTIVDKANIFGIYCDKNINLYTVVAGGNILKHNRDLVGGPVFKVIPTGSTAYGIVVDEKNGYIYTIGPSNYLKIQCIEENYIVNK